MSDLSIVRVRRSRVRRSSAAVVLASGLTFGVVAVGIPGGAASAAPASSANVVGLQKGASGESVEALQNALNRVGIGVKYGVDGYFGSATQASVKAFQRYKHLPITGVVDAATAAALGFAGAAAPTAVAAPAAAAPAPAAAGALAPGARGAAVSALQQALMNAGRLTGRIDGIFGLRTWAAVKAFQQAKGISPSGTVDATTAAALGLGAAAPAAPAATAAAPAASSVIGLQLGSQGPAVTQLQQAMIKMGWPFAGGADGVFGASTRTTLMAVQRANGITPSGTVDTATARMFGLADAASAATLQTTAAAATTATGYAVYDEHGARVLALQQALIAQGVALRGGTDGVFGSGTLTGVLTLQRARGLPATGKVDAATAAALGLAAMDAPAPAAVEASTIALEAKPLQGPCYYGDTWLAARSVGRVHLGVDIIAKEGNELYAVATGTITKIYTVDKDPLTGNGLRIARPDGTYFFYGHLSALAPGIAVGTPVTAGQLVGYVGHTGNAGVSHLHLEVHPGGGSAVNPYPIVKAIGAC